MVGNKQRSYLERNKTVVKERVTKREREWQRETEIPRKREMQRRTDHTKRQCRKHDSADDILLHRQTNCLYGALLSRIYIHHKGIRWDGTGKETNTLNNGGSPVALHTAGHGRYNVGHWKKPYCPRGLHLEHTSRAADLDREHSYWGGKRKNERIGWYIGECHWMDERMEA